MILKQKRGDTQLTLKNIVVLILSVVVLIILVSYGIKLYNFFTGKQEDEATKNNFKNLKLALDTLMKQEGEAHIVISYYLKGIVGGQNYALIGFPGKNGYIDGKNIDIDHVIEYCSGGGKAYMEKPRDRCGLFESCLCLYQLKGDRYLDCYTYTDEFGDNPLDGFYVNRTALFDKPYKGAPININERKDLNTLVIWGQCSTFTWKVRAMTIRKEIRDGNTSIIFSKFKEGDQKGSIPLEGEDILGKVELFGEKQE